MNRVIVSACLALSVAALPILAEESATLKTASASTAVSAETQEQTPPATADDQEKKETPTPEEVVGKVDAITEAMTDMRNTLDALNRLKISGYVQAQYVNDQSSVNQLTSSTATKNKDQFSVRRARVKFTYQASPTARFVLQPDISSSGVTLKDGYAEFIEPWTSWHHTLTAGQFNWPFGFEIAYSSSDREVPERSRMYRTLFPGERDRGVQLSGVGIKDHVNYKIAIVNGTGTSQSFDFNKRKDLVGRLGFSVGPVDFGFSGYRGSDLVVVTGKPTGRELSKRREGVDVQWVTPLPGLGIRGEYIRGKERGASVEGYYVYVIQNIGTKNQFIVRADRYNPNEGHDLKKSASLSAITDYAGSYIFHWDANSKVMFAYERQKTASSDVTVDPRDNIFTLRYQYKF